MNVGLGRGKRAPRAPGELVSRTALTVVAPRHRDAFGAETGVQRVLLVCPPFQAVSPSPLAIAHLATFLREHGVPCEEAYLHFELSLLIGREHYSKLASKMALIGEMLFAEALHGAPADADIEAELTSAFGDLAARRALIDALTVVTLARLDSIEPEVVGATTSLNQLMPALWLARVVKGWRSSVKVVLGGSACASPMGEQLLRSYPELDVVVSGFGERPLLSMGLGAEARERLVECHDLPELDDLPIPDYRAFMKAAAAAGIEKTTLTFESSRGCWWGQKNHCTFCGLNGTEMQFREKSSGRVVSEIRALWERYGMNLFATDTIMSRRHLEEVPPRLAAHEAGPVLFYEVKVNMSEAEVVRLRRANVRALQPGIESLSTRLLKLMKKGSIAIQNLALMKWARERGIAVAWNQLCGIPGETEADYDDQIALMKRIPQLPPPEDANPVHIDRFSPYFKNYAAFGWSRIEPLPEYRSLHPALSEAEVSELAYHFRGIGGVTTDAYLDRFRAEIQNWRRRCFANEGLFLHPQHGLVRNGPAGGQRLYGPGLDRILECTHRPAPLHRVLEHSRCDEKVLVRLTEDGVLFMEAGKVLNLAIRTEPPAGD